MRIFIFVLTLSVFSCSGFPVYDYELPVTEEALNASIARINSQSWGTNLYGVVRSHVTRVDMWNSDAYRLELRFSIRETVCTKASGRDPSTCDFKIGPFVMGQHGNDGGCYVFFKDERAGCCKVITVLQTPSVFSSWGNTVWKPTTFCRSVVDVSGELISNIIVQCHRGTSSSESMSSEENLYSELASECITGSLDLQSRKTACEVLKYMMHMPIMNPNRRGSSRREDVFAPEAFPSRGRGSSRGDWHKPSYFSSDKIE